jgi:predicted transcriptional regulator of viral defense system
MKFSELLDLVGDLAVFRGSLPLAGDRDANDVRRQLARWTAAGKVLQLRRNVYVLAKPWRRVDPHPFVIANELNRPSYVSLESALAHHGLIPEGVPVTTSVSTGRPATLDTVLGRYLYRHVQHEAFFGYEQVEVTRDQTALIARPEKALLDLVHLTTRGESLAYLESLRLENLDALEWDELRAVVRKWAKPKLARAAANVLELSRRELGGLHS